MIFFTAPGMTFLLSIYVDRIFRDLSIPLSEFVWVYSLATLGASFLLNPIGRLLDRKPLSFVVVGAVLTMVFGCVGLASARGAISLFVPLMALRLVGQGAFGLIASTTISRRFQQNRGKALAWIMLGFPLSELIFPTLTLLLLGAVDWRWTWAIYGMAMVVILLPIQLSLIKKFALHHHHFLPGEADGGEIEAPSGSDFVVVGTHQSTPKEVLRDPVFYWMLVAYVVPPTWMTVLFIYQSLLFAENHWPIYLAAAGVGVYSIAKVVGGLGVGVLIDKYGVTWPFVVMTVLMGVGVLTAGIGGSKVTLFVYFLLTGLSLGMAMPIMDVVWAVLYGTEHLGAIKGYVQMTRNGMTALGPIPFAMMISLGMPLDWIYQVLGVATIAMGVIPLWVRYRYKRMKDPCIISSGRFL